jgi:hypothetical protein
MTYKEFSDLVLKRVKRGDKRVVICMDYGIYPQKLIHYLKAAKTSPDKLVPVELNETMKQWSKKCR